MTDEKNLPEQPANELTNEQLDKVAGGAARSTNCKPKGDQPYLKITLENVLVSSY